MNMPNQDNEILAGRTKNGDRGVVNLPGFPDNALQRQGQFWVAIDCCRRQRRCSPSGRGSGPRIQSSCADHAHEEGGREDATPPRALDGDATSWRCSRPGRE
ncbi:hypothetical protein PR202_ga26287 [Eleusine coracana subsp. coracana]|uniref:Uncharacterized protein n=1 Tax=Eleusine coracana subsp. coracana TaxID=191504 RepID=A0AAV5DDL4_ELECO|nr:hypothetical protein PR202_ga26287 [Eleusine coracana subsp. coracana]